MAEDVLVVGNDDDNFSDESSFNSHEKDETPKEECRHVQSRARPGSHPINKYSKPPRKPLPTRAPRVRPPTPEWRSPRNRGSRPNYYESNQKGPNRRHRSHDKSKSPERKSKTPAQDRIKRNHSRDSYKTPAQDRLKRHVHSNQDLPRLTRREEQSCIPAGKWTDQRVRLNKQKEAKDNLRMKKARDEGQSVTVRTSNSSSGSNRSSNSSVPQDEIENDARREISHKMRFKLVDGVYIPSNDPEAQAGPSRRTFSDRLNDYIFVNSRMMTLPQAAVYLDGLERDRVAAGDDDQSDDDANEPEEQIKTKEQSKRDLRRKKDDEERNGRN